jgi:hypothetical protein
MLNKRAKTDKQKKEILDELFKIWKTLPHWRLGQLIANYIRDKGDIFFPEDYDLIKELKKFAKKYE